MTIGSCFDRVMKLINYYSAAGTVIPSTDGNQTDLYARAIALMDAAQEELSAAEPILKSAALLCRSIPNLLSACGVCRVGTGLTFEADGAHACTFSTDGETSAAVTQLAGGVETALATVETSASDGPLTYAAVFTPDSGARVRLTFTGDCLIRDIALYAECFADASDVPAYGEFRFYPLPPDVCLVRTVNLRQVAGGARPDFRGYRLLDGKLGLPWDFCGEACVVYEARPAQITDTDARTASLCVSERAAQGVVYYTAAGLAAEEQPALADRFRTLYREVLIGLSPQAVPRGIENRMYAARKGVTL